MKAFPTVLLVSRSKNTTHFRTISEAFYYVPVATLFTMLFLLTGFKVAGETGGDVFSGTQTAACCGEADRGRVK